MALTDIICAFPMPAAGLYMALLSGCTAFSSQGATDFSTVGGIAHFHPDTISWLAN